MKNDKPLAVVASMMKEILDDNPFARCYLTWRCACGQTLSNQTPGSLKPEVGGHAGCRFDPLRPVFGLKVDYPLFPYVDG